MKKIFNIFRTTVLTIGLVLFVAKTASAAISFLPEIQNFIKAFRSQDRDVLLGEGTGNSTPGITTTTCSKQGYKSSIPENNTCDRRTISDGTTCYTNCKCSAEFSYDSACPDNMNTSDTCQDSTGTQYKCEQKQCSDFNTNYMSNLDEDLMCTQVKTLENDGVDCWNCSACVADYQHDETNCDFPTGDVCGGKALHCECPVSIGDCDLGCAEWAEPLGCEKTCIECKTCPRLGNLNSCPVNNTCEFEQCSGKYYITGCAVGYIDENAYWDGADANCETIGNVYLSDGTCMDYKEVSETPIAVIVAPNIAMSINQYSERDHSDATDMCLSFNQGDGWVLPSLEDWQTIFPGIEGTEPSNLSTINNYFTRVGGANLNNDYWTSTLADYPDIYSFMPHLSQPIPSSYTIAERMAVCIKKL